MATNLAAALQTLRPVQVPDATQRVRTLADARAMQQQEEMRGLQIQGVRDEREAAMRAVQEAAAVSDVLKKHGGDYKSALPELRVIAPQFARSIDEADRKAGLETRKADLDEAQLREKRNKNAYDQMMDQFRATNPPPTQQIPGRDVPLPPEVEAQQIRMRPTPQQVPGRDVPLPAEVEAQRTRMTTAGGSTSPEPLVAIIGEGGSPVLVPRSQAVGKQPASSREQGRAVTSGDANRIADFDTSLDDLATLRKEIPKGSTGNAAKFGAMLPDAVTDLTGFGTIPKQKQATIDRVKQVIGKALEGGVLRKEDEYKYEKILPKLADTSAVVESKLNGLDRAIRQRRVTLLDSLDDAGYDVAQFRSRDSGPAGIGEWKIIEVK